MEKLLDIDKKSSLKERRDLEQKVAEILGWVDIRLARPHLVNGDRKGHHPRYPKTLRTVPRYTEDHNAWATVEELMQEKGISFSIEFFPAVPQLAGEVENAEIAWYECGVWSEIKGEMVFVGHTQKLIGLCLAFIEAHTPLIEQPYLCLKRAA